MVASTATDPSGVEYYFECAAGECHNSGWQDSVNYTDSGLIAGTVYSYRVKARDKSSADPPNETGWSSTLSATTDPAVDNAPPNPDPMTWATTPNATNSTSINMVASTATDPSGVEYYFECAAGECHNSGWQDSVNYTDSGLIAGTVYSYRVKARDKSSADPPNETGWSSTLSATTDPAVDNAPRILIP